LKTPLWLLENKTLFSSNEKELPPMETVFMNCSIEYFLISRHSAGIGIEHNVNKEIAEHISALSFTDSPDVRE
jgi:hypothetical protein